MTQQWWCAIERPIIGTPRHVIGKFLTWNPKIDAKSALSFTFAENMVKLYTLLIFNLEKDDKSSSIVPSLVKVLCKVRLKKLYRLQSMSTLPQLHLGWISTLRQI